MTEAIARRVTDYREFLLYAVIGVSGVLLDLVAFLLLYNVFGMSEFAATFASTTLGIVNNFVLNVQYNFRTKDRLATRFLRFYAVGAAGILLTMGLFALFSHSLGIDPNVVKVGSLPVVLVFQYLLNKKWTFQK
jgi:putative flippase GtrA